MKLDLGHYRLIRDQRGSEGARGGGGINNHKFRSWNGPDGTRVGHIGLSLKHIKLDLGHYRLI